MPLMNRRRCQCDDELSEFSAAFDDPTVPWWEKLVMVATLIAVFGILALGLVIFA